MTFLDQRDHRVRGETSHDKLTARAGVPPAVEPPEFDACPVLLTQPAEGRWTPHHLSVPVLSRITGVPVETVMLDNAGPVQRRRRGGGPRREDQYADEQPVVVEVRQALQGAHADSHRQDVGQRLQPLRKVGGGQCAAAGRVPEDQQDDRGQRHAGLAEQPHERHGRAADGGGHQGDDPGDPQEGAGQRVEPEAAGDQRHGDAAEHAERAQARHPPAVREARRHLVGHHAEQEAGQDDSESRVEDGHAPAVARGGGGDVLLVETVTARLGDLGEGADDGGGHGRPVGPGVQQLGGGPVAPHVGGVDGALLYGLPGGVLVGVAPHLEPAGHAALQAVGDAVGLRPGADDRDRQVVRLGSVERGQEDADEEGADDQHDRDREQDTREPGCALRPGSGGRRLTF